MKVSGSMRHNELFSTFSFGCWRGKPVPLVKGMVLCVRFTVSLRFELQGGHSKLSTSLATDKNGP